MTRPEIIERIETRQTATEDLAIKLNELNISPQVLSKGTGLGWHVANRLINNKYKYMQANTLRRIDNWLMMYTKGYRWDLH